MKRIISAFIVLVAIVVTMIACDDKPNEPGNGSTYVIVPFAVGDRSVFKVTDYDEAGSVTEISYDTILVVKDTTIEGDVWYVVEGFDYTSYNRNTDNGMEEWTPSGTCMLFKYPASEGNEYDCSLYDIHFEVGAANAEVTVEHGTHTCYEYIQTTMSGLGDSIYQYCCIDTGLVLWENYSPVISGNDTLFYLRKRHELTELVW